MAWLQAPDVAKACVRLVPLPELGCYSTWWVVQCHNVLCQEGQSWHMVCKNRKQHVLNTEPYDVLGASRSQMADEIDMHTLPSVHLLPL